MLVSFRMHKITVKLHGNIIVYVVTNASTVGLIELVVVWVLIMSSIQRVINRKFLRRARWEGLRIVVIE